MRRAASLVAAALLLAACGDAPRIPATDLLLRVTPTEAEVEFGKAFSVEVERIWNRDLVVRDFDEGVLAPLVLRAEGARREQDDRRVREILRYRAYAFSLEDVQIRAPKLVGRPRGDGPKQEIYAEPIRLRVKQAIDVEDPGAPELLSTMVAEPSSRWPLGIAALGALALLALFLRRPRREGRRLEVASADLALRRLGEVGSDVAAMSDVLRDHVGALRHRNARPLTTGEVLALMAPEDGDEARESLAAVLEAGDMAKYGARDFDAETAGALATRAASFIESTRSATP